jgi:hypothetical protein
MEHCDAIIAVKRDKGVALLPVQLSHMIESGRPPKDLMSPSCKKAGKDPGSQQSFVRSVRLQRLADGD